MPFNPLYHQFCFTFACLKRLKKSLQCISMNLKKTSKCTITYKRGRESWSENTDTSFFFYQPGAGISTCREQMFSPFLSFLTEATGYRERTFINRAQSCSKHRFLLSKQDTVTKNTNLMLVRLSTHLIKLMQKAVFVSVDHAAIYSRLHTFSLSLAHTLIL